MASLVLGGVAVVLPDRVLSPATLAIEDGRIAAIEPGVRGVPTAGSSHHTIVAGFVDAHVHGVEGIDCLDDARAVQRMAARMPRYGVTAFAPTAVACEPAVLRGLLDGVALARAAPGQGAARVLPAHLESHFINPGFCGAQPLECLRAPVEALVGWESRAPAVSAPFTGADVLREIARAPHAVGIVTLAPELDGGLDLVAWLTGRGIGVSLGHSAATYEEAEAAVLAGARRATHLFNCMPALHHRKPGLAGAVLSDDRVAAEIICDGVHVHPAVIKATVAAKGVSRVMAVSDATAVAGLGSGASARLGNRTIGVRGGAACLSDGTLAGSATMLSGMFRVLVRDVGLSLVEAAALCAATPAAELGLTDAGRLETGARADLTVLDQALDVVQTYIAGELVYSRAPGGPTSPHE